nr:MAG TPA: hypothetical protein [Caudoviricetes sp.]
MESAQRAGCGLVMSNTLNKPKPNKYSRKARQSAAPVS